MRRFLTIAIFSFFIVYNLVAVEYGGLISSDSSFEKIGESDFLFIEKLDSSAYFKVPLTREGKLVFSTEVFYRFQYNQPEINHFVDLPLLKLSYDDNFGTEDLSISMGRFPLVDRTAKIFNQTSDGLFASFATENYVTSFYFGYTGLINRHLVTMEEGGITEFSGFESDYYSSSLPYIVTNATITLPFVLLQQTVTAEFWGFSGIQNLKSNKLYGSLALNGPIIGNLFHNTEGIFAAILNDGTVDLAGLASTRLSYYFDLLGIATHMGVGYASEKFQTVTDVDALAMGANWTNLFIPSASVTLLPLSSLFVGIESSVALAANNMDYIGTDLVALINYQLFSDVALGVSASHFFAQEEALQSTKISIKAAISF